MLFVVHYCYRFPGTVGTIFCARLLPFFVRSLFHFLCTRNFCLHKAFRKTAATVKAMGQAMNTTSLVNKAVSIRDVDQKKKRTYDQCWVVFDKDDFPTKDFNEAIALAERNGFKVAYSNHTFEYWFLLHLQPHAIKNAAAVLSEISHGNPALEESSTTVHLLVEELNKYI